jgi:hypothetical protein
MGGVGGETGGVMASLGLSATRVNGQYIGPRMIRREEKIRTQTALAIYNDDGSILGFDGYTSAGDSLRVWYEPFGGLFFNGNSGGQQPRQTSQNVQPLPRRTCPSITVITYQATADGLEIELGARTSSGYPEHRWVQSIITNKPLGGMRANIPYNDPQPPDDRKPYYFTDQELADYQNRDGFNLLFEDRPKRPTPTRGVVRWKANLALVGILRSGGVNYRSLITIKYGFERNANGQVTLLPIRIGNARNCR